MEKDFMREFADDVYQARPGQDNDHPTCPRCGGQMSFHGDDLPIGEGYWDCDGCDFSFTEDELDEYID